MPRLTQEKINEIRQSVDIVDVIGSYLPLNKKGRNYMAVCPFHDDTHPSMSISPEKQIFMCFVCHHGGNVFTFLKDYLKISYIEAVKMVAKLGNVDISEYQIQEKKPQINQETEPMYLMHEEANKIYRHYLNTKLAIDAKDYLNDRQITDEIIDYFEIGYAIKDNVLLSAFEKLDYSRIDAIASGLVIESNQGYDRFSDRIMFPLHNVNGRIVGFSGRIYKKNQNESKYMNSPESKIFIKGETLYNYHRAKDEVRNAGKIIINEGFMDVIALYKVGIKNAVAIMGTALTNNHINMLKRLTNNVVMCLDGDNAGKNATIKCIDVLTKSGFTVSVVKLPGSMDPDEVLNTKGKDELLAIINNPISSLEFVMDYYYDSINVNNYEDRKGYLEKMAVIIGQIEDIIDQDYYIEELVKKSGFSKEMILKVVNQNKVIKQPVIEKPITYQQSVKLVDKYQKAERDLLYYMMHDKKYAMIYEAKAGFMYDKVNRVIASYIVDYYRQYVVLEIADLINSIEDQEIVKNIIDIASLNLPDLKDNQAIDDYIKIIKEHALKQRKSELTKALANTYDQNQKAKILEEIIALKERD